MLNLNARCGSFYCVCMVITLNSLEVNAYFCDNLQTFHKTLDTQQFENNQEIFDSWLTFHVMLG